MDNIQWHVEKRRVSDLKPYHKNPRIITEAGLRELRESFEEIGFAQPINIDTDNTILSGHARVYELKEQDADQEVIVLVPHRKLTDLEQEAVIIRMNKNIAGQWDFDILANQFEMENLAQWGFDEKEFIKLDPIDEVGEKDIDLDAMNFNNTCPKCGYEY